ncbi:MAG: hypothetical protein IPL40_01575 [Proteobacteria bacterium]|nr:hypothetical protein [Pseudomonadota bacterium]
MDLLAYAARVFGAGGSTLTREVWTQQRAQANRLTEAANDVWSLGAAYVQAVMHWYGPSWSGMPAGHLQLKVPRQASSRAVAEGAGRRRAPSSDLMLQFSGGSGPSEGGFLSVTEAGAERTTLVLPAQSNRAPASPPAGSGDEVAAHATRQLWLPEAADPIGISVGARAASSDWPSPAGDGAPQAYPSPAGPLQVAYGLLELMDGQLRAARAGCELAGPLSGVGHLVPWLDALLDQLSSARRHWAAVAGASDRLQASFAVRDGGPRKGRLVERLALVAGADPRAARLELGQSPVAGGAGGAFRAVLQGEKAVLALSTTALPDGRIAIGVEGTGGGKARGPEVIVAPLPPGAAASAMVVRGVDFAARALTGGGRGGVVQRPTAAPCPSRRAAGGVGGALGI